MNKKRIIPFILLAASVILAVVSIIVLPDVVIVQFSTGSSRITTMPKAFAIAIPFVLGAGGALFGFASNGANGSNRKPLIVSAVGSLVFIIMIFVNCIL